MIPSILFSTLFFACGEAEQQQQVKEAKPTCNLSLDDLNNTTWFYESTVGGAPMPDSKIRLKLYTEERKLKAKYNMGQATSMYDYDCISKPSQIICSTKPDPVDVCLSFFAADKKCTRKSLENFYKKTAGMTLEKKEMREANLKAEEKIIEWKKNGTWENRYQRLYNSIGKRQMGILYAKVDTTACTLQVTDNFGALANGDFIEDAASVVGTNKFLKHTTGDVLWEGCTDTDNTLWTTTLAEIPENGFTGKDAKKILFTGEDTHFWMLSDKVNTAEKDAKYSYAIWLNGQEFGKGEAKVEDKKVNWHNVQKFDTPNVKGDYNLVAFQTFKEVGGEKEAIGTYCSKFQVANKQQ